MEQLEDQLFLFANSKDPNGLDEVLCTLRSHGTGEGAITLSPRAFPFLLSRTVLSIVGSSWTKRSLAAKKTLENLQFVLTQDLTFNKTNY